MGRISDVVGHGDRLPPGEGGGAGIALLFSGVPVLEIAGRLDLGLMGLHFGLLQAEHVGVGPLKIIKKTLFRAGPQAVHVPRDELHGKVLLRIQSCVLLFYTMGRGITR